MKKFDFFYPVNRSKVLREVWLGESSAIINAAGENPDLIMNCFDSGTWSEDILDHLGDRDIIDIEPLIIDFSPKNTPKVSHWVHPDIESYVKFGNDDEGVLI